jgi:hypothetical protein
MKPAISYQPLAINYQRTARGPASARGYSERVREQRGSARAGLHSKLAEDQTSAQGSGSAREGN